MDLSRDLPPRARRFDELERAAPDVLVVGGGITGAGIALDLACRGIRTALFERDDWAAGTSSASSRLIHGGLRYLENLEFSLVRDSCLERGLLLQNAAGLVWPETFVFPLHRGAPVGRLKLAAGLALYTLVSTPRLLGLPRMHSAREVARRIPGVRTEGLLGGGSYLDGATDDARLTLAVVLSALSAGAVALSRMEVLSIEDGAAGARVRARDVLGAEERELTVRAVVLAGGPRADDLRRLAGLPDGWIRPTRGTHVLVPRRRLPTDGAVIFPSPLDGRVMFLIPWPRYTVLGTTDVDAAPEAPVRSTHAEVRYLLDSANGLVPGAELGEEDVVSTWAGLRPLLAADASTPSARSREERVQREGNIYTIAGGKLTGFRSMAERLGTRIARETGLGNPSRHSPTRALLLHGALSKRVQRPGWSSRPSLDPIADAWDRRYAALRSRVEDLCRRVEAGRDELDAETLLGEVDWAVRHEDCLSARDFFLRRTDLGYGELAPLRAVEERVLSRLAHALSWSSPRLAAERADWARSRDALHAWRREGAPKSPHPAFKPL